MHQAIAPAGPKGKPPLRPCPDDFRVIFVEKGRDSCEAWYRVSRRVVNRWLEECGKDELIARRAAFVASQRKAGRWLTRQTAMVAVRAVKVAPRQGPIRDRRKISPIIARHAAQYLRIVRNGGFIVSMAQTGDWFVGTKRLSAAQMVNLAVSKGFDPKGAHNGS